MRIRRRMDRETVGVQVRGLRTAANNREWVGFAGQWHHHARQHRRVHVRTGLLASAAHQPPSDLHQRGEMVCGSAHVST